MLGRTFFLILLALAVNIEPIKCQCCSHIETSQLTCYANQSTGFYMRAILAFNGLKQIIKLLKNCKTQNAYHISTVCHRDIVPLALALLQPQGSGH